ncbi:hypothetical protein ES703_75260 [subsurface metagenome]
MESWDIPRRGYIVYNKKTNKKGEKRNGKYGKIKIKSN